MASYGYTHGTLCHSGGNSAILIVAVRRNAENLSCRKKRRCRKTLTVSLLNISFSPTARIFIRAINFLNCLKCLVVFSNFCYYLYYLFQSLTLCPPSLSFFLSRSRSLALSLSLSLSLSIYLSIYLSVHLPFDFSPLFTSVPSRPRRDFARLALVWSSPASGQRPSDQRTLFLRSFVHNAYVYRRDHTRVRDLTSPRV